MNGPKFDRKSEALDKEPRMKSKAKRTAHVINSDLREIYFFTVLDYNIYSRLCS